MIAERAHVRRAAARLVELIEQTAQDLTETLAERTTNKAGLEDRDAMAVRGARRLKALRAGTGPLCFGRIDLDDGESLVVGRTGVADRDMEPLVVDWRAPAAAPFYKATGPAPLGVVRRRHFMCRKDEVVGLDDEVFDRGRADGAGLGLVGEAALLSALSQSRGERMGDIVATIQREQHEVIHAPLPGALIVQGGAGTGKTAVALHRAAFLLYAFRFSLETAGVLFIGPNRRFLTYVGDVLPSLGETAVHMATVTELVDGVSATATDTEVVSRLKHDVRMADVIAAAVRGRERPLRRALRVGYGTRQVVLAAKVIAPLIDATRASAAPTHNARARVLRDLLLDALRQRYVRAEQRRRDAGLRVAGVTASEADAFVKAAGRSREVRMALARMWPILTGEQVVGDLLGNPALIADAAHGILNDEEITALQEGGLHRAPDAEPAWTSADVALIDEASHLLGAKPRRQVRRPTQLTEGEQFDIDQVLDEMPGLSPVIRDDIIQRLTAQALAARDDPNEVIDSSLNLGRWRAYGHVLVDEAQDLSPMQWRMIARRSATRSFTIVGDLAQGTSPWSSPTWTEVASTLDAQPNIVELSVGYRTPAEVMTIATRLLAATHPGLQPPHPVRMSGHAPGIVRTDEHSLIAEALAAAEQLRFATGGSVALVAPMRLLESFTELADGTPLVILDPIGVKGLEFDGVVVIEPAEIAAGAGGLAALYIAVTRTTNRLTIVHSRPLPAALAPVASS